MIENGKVKSMDGIDAADFDMIDIFIARHHLDPNIAAEAMAMPSGEIARMLVDSIAAYHAGGFRRQRRCWQRLPRSSQLNAPP